MVEAVSIDYNDTEKQFAIDLSSATITICDDEDENKSELSESTSNADNSLTLSDSNIPPNTNFNIDKSSGVIIGPVSHFHRSVTIIQNAANNFLELENENQPNGIKTNYDSTTLSSAQVAETNKQPEINNKKKKCSIKKIIFLTFLILAAIGLILFAIFYSLGVYISNENNKPTDDKHTYENKSQIPNSLHKIIYRDRWGGRKPLYERPQKTPVKYVIISHTAGSFCESITDCSSQMVQMQSQHVSALSPDIGYNFVIGGDDNIYVGRGWDNHNFHMNLDTIGICFMGNYVYNTLKPGMIEATHELLKLGVEKGKLDKDYILVAHNQTYNTISPGPNIYSQIKFWPHFSPEILLDIEEDNK